MMSDGQPLPALAVPRRLLPFGRRVIAGNITYLPACKGL